MNSTVARGVKLALLACLLAPASAISAGDDQTSDGQQTYFKWFLEELELGRCNRCRSGRGVATYSPVESPDRPPVHFPRNWRSQFVPYYSRVIPSSTRWSPTVYAPYYRGYLLTGKVSREPYCVYVPTANGDAGSYPSNSYGAYAGAPQDVSELEHLGGEGPYQGNYPDIISDGGGSARKSISKDEPPQNCGRDD